MNEYYISVDAGFTVWANDYDSAVDKIKRQFNNDDNCDCSYMETRLDRETELFYVDKKYKFTMEYQDKYGMAGHSDYYGTDMYICKKSKKIYTICYTPYDRAVIFDETMCCDNCSDDVYITHPVVINYYCCIDDIIDMEYMHKVVDEYERNPYIYFANIIGIRDEVIDERKEN